MSNTDSDAQEPIHAQKPSARAPKVLVLGGRGFVGRHAVRALRAAGAQVVIGSRQRGEASDQVSVRLEELQTAAQWQALFARQGELLAVLNCVGILRPRGAATYEKVHHYGPRALAQACAASGARFVHVSALGLHQHAGSRFLTSKLRGETAIARYGQDWAIARPSLIDGDGGFGAAWFRGVARLPIFVVPADARGKIAALTADDLGVALARLCLGSAAALRLSTSREFGLGGAHSYTFEEYVRALRQRHTSHRAMCVRIPGLLARAGAHLCDVFHATPFSFGHWELLRRDNEPRPNRLGELLGRAPTNVVAPPPSGPG